MRGARTLPLLGGAQPGCVAEKPLTPADWQSPIAWQKAPRSSYTAALLQLQAKNQVALPGPQVGTKHTKQGLRLPHTRCEHAAHT